MTTTRVEKLNELKKVLSSDLLACDVMISILTSAALSFKRDSLLVPFPKCYLKDSVKDFEKLMADLAKIPSAEEFLLLLLNDNVAEIVPEDAISLLHSVLTEPKYSLKSTARSEHDSILGLSKKSVGKIIKPQYIFEANYTSTAAEVKFQQLKKKFGNSDFVFHGTKFSQVYSILNTGLHQHLNKTSLYGEGLYFAQSLEVSLLFSPQNAGWNKSKCGENLSCVLLCEYVDDGEHVKTRKENAKNSEIPIAYLLITNNELVRVRYLLVYGSKTAATPPAKVADASLPPPKATLMTWCRKNPFVVSLCLYLLFLFFVGVSNTRAAEYYKKIFYDFLKRWRFS